MSPLSLGEVLLLIAFLWHLSHQAGRLDRLHHRIDVASAALDGHLARRAATVADLATHLDPASGVILAEAAYAARSCDPSDFDNRMNVENVLTSALKATLEDDEDVAELRKDPTINLLLDELVADSRRLELSRRFHADAVQACIHLRQQRLVRMFRLAGRAPTPRTMDFDDQLPASLR